MYSWSHRQKPAWGKKVYDSWIPSGSYINERAREKGPSKGVLNFFP